MPQSRSSYKTREFLPSRLEHFIGNNSCMFTDLRKSGVNHFLDLARQTYKELHDDANDYYNQLKGMASLTLHLYHR
jgi:hypothetical protein